MTRWVWAAAAPLWMMMATGCDEAESAPVEACQQEGEQGILGRVVRRSGNWMPGAGGDGDGEEVGVATTVALFPVLTEADVTPATDKPDAYGRYTVNDATPAATTTTNAQGCFALDAPSGTYTVLAEDEGAWYCNSFDSEGLCRLTWDGTTAQVSLVIDYEAAY